MVKHMNFWHRLVQVNGPFLVRTFRSLADELERLAPGSAAVGIILLHTKGETRMGAITVKDDHADLTATVTFMDAEGHETTPDMTPVWTSSDEAVCTVTAAEGGMSATISIGGPGVAVIDAREMETNDATGDTAEVIAQGTVTVQPGDAVIGSVEFSE